MCLSTFVSVYAFVSVRLCVCVSAASLCVRVCACHIPLIVFPLGFISAAVANLAWGGGLIT